MVSFMAKKIFEEGEVAKTFYWTVYDDGSFEIKGLAPSRFWDRGEIHVAPRQAQAFFLAIAAVHTARIQVALAQQDSSG